MVLFSLAMRAVCRTNNRKQDPKRVDSQAYSIHDPPSPTAYESYLSQSKWRRGARHLDGATVQYFGPFNKGLHPAVIERRPDTSMPAQIRYSPDDYTEFLPATHDYESYEQSVLDETHVPYDDFLQPPSHESSLKPPPYEAVRRQKVRAPNKGLYGDHARHSC